MDTFYTEDQIIDQLRAELIGLINYLPTEQAREILERMLYFGNNQVSLSIEKEKMVNSFMSDNAKSVNAIRIQKLYQQLTKLYESLDFDKLKGFESSIDQTEIRRGSLTYQFEEEQFFNIVTVDISNGALMLLSDRCSIIQKERFIETEESWFYQDSNSDFSLTSYWTLKEIISKEDFKVRNLARKSIIYNGRELREGDPEFFINKEVDSGDALLDNKAMVKVLTSTSK